MVALPRLDAPELLAFLLALVLVEQGSAEEDGGVDFVQDRNVLIDSGATHVETVSDTLGVHGVRHVDEHVDLAALDGCLRVRLAADKGLEDLLDVGNALVFEPFLGTLGGEDLVAHLLEELNSDGEFLALCRLANGDKNVLLGHLEAGGDERLKIGLVPFFENK